MKLGDGFIAHATDLLDNFQASIACFSKTNTAWVHSNAFPRVHSILKRRFQHAQFSMSSSGLPSPTLFQMGGTCTTALGKWCGRASERGKDNATRFSWIKICGRRGRIITVITCYRVSQTIETYIGPYTAYTQHKTLLRDSG